MLGMCRQSFVVTGVAVAMLGSGQSAWADPVGIVEGWIAQSEAYEWVTISHDGVEHDAASGITTINGLTIVVAGYDLPGMSTDTDDSATTETVDFSYSFSFPALVFDGLSIDGDYYTASAIRADTLDIEFTVESATEGSTTSTGAYDGLSVTNARWARLPEIEDDPLRPVSRFYPLVAALVDVSFDAAEFGALEIVSETSEPDVSTVVTYGAGRIGQTVRGNMSNMEVGEITIEAFSSEGESDATDFLMDIGGFKAETYNYGDMIRLFDPTLEPGTGDEPYETVAGMVSMYDWGLTAEGADFSVGDLRMEELGLRRPTIPFLARLDDLYMRAVDTGEDPDPEKVIELVAAFYGMFRLGLLELRDVEGSSEDFNGSLASVGVSGLSADGIESIFYRGFEASDGSGEVEAKLGDFTISNFLFPSLGALMNFERAQEEGDIDTMLAAIPKIGGISLADLLVNVPFVAELSLKRAAIESSDHIGPIPTRIGSVIDDLRLPTWMLDDDSAEVMASLGYDEIASSSNLELVWQETDQTIALRSENVLVDGGRLRLTATVGGIPREALENPMSLMFLAFAMTLNEATLEFEDDSLTERALAFFAEDQGTDVTTMRAQALGIIPFIAAPLQRPEFLTALTTAASAFLAEPGTLRLTMLPDAPVPFMALMEAADGDDPGRLIDLLNVKISAE